MADPTDPLASADPDALARASAELGVQLSFATGAAKSLSQYLLAMTESVEQAVMAMAKLAAQSAPPKPADLIDALPDSHVGEFPTAIPAGHRENEQGGRSWTPPVARTVEAADLGDAIHDTAGPAPEAAEVLAVLRDIRELIRKMQGFGGRPIPQPPDRKHSHSMSWMERVREKARQGLNRAGRRLFGSKRYNALRVKANAVRSVVGKRWAAATVGRGAAGAVVGGARAGAAAGAMIGPIGVAGGLVLGGIVAAGMKVFSVGESLFNQLAQQLTRYLSPVAMMSRAIESQTSGSSVTAKSASLLGNVLGMVLAPAFIFLSAVLMTLAAELAGPISSAVAKFGGVALDKGIQAVELFAAVCGYAYEKAMQLADGFAAVAKSPLFHAILMASGATGWAILSATNSPGKAAGQVAGVAPYIVAGVAGKVISQDFKGYLERTGRNNLIDGSPNNGPRSEGGGNDPSRSLRLSLLNGLRLSVAEMRRQVGGQAQATELGSVQRSAQLAAMNTSPIDVEILKVQQQNLKNLERILAELEQQGRGNAIQ